MRVAVFGATGFIGRRVVQALAARGDVVVAYSRDPARAKSALGERVECRANDAVDGASLADIDAVVNLAGEPIAEHRWNDAVKARLRSSRLDLTRAVVEALASAAPRPSVLVNASAVGYYGPCGDEEVTEDAPPGDDFLATLCRDWEAEARRAEAHGVRVVRARMGVVLGEAGGSLEKMLLPFKLFVGGPIGDGKQWFPWVHLDDAAGMIAHAVDHDALRGAANITAPSPVRFGAFADALGKALHRPAWLPVPSFALKAVAGEVAEVLLTGQRATPGAMSRSGYRFAFPSLDAALRDVLRS
ncbi:MAG: TIGR01777 family oxidoreductase [Polyangiales bacterium]